MCFHLTNWFRGFYSIYAEEKAKGEAQGLKLTSGDCAILYVIAEEAHCPECDDTDENGTRLYRGRHILARHMFMTREDMALRLYIKPDAATKAIARLDKRLSEATDGSVHIRAGKAYPGRAMTYRLPTESELWKAVGLDNRLLGSKEND